MPDVALPRLLLVADGFSAGRPELDADAVRGRTLALVEAGVPWVMLRDHEAEPALFASTAESLAADLRDANPGVRLSVNARLDVALGLGAGVHVGRRGPSVAEAVGAGAEVVGFSAHSATQARAAALGGAAYATFSPDFRTRTHPDADPAGLDPLGLAARTAQIPVLALGGLTPPRARLARMVGAHGAAVVSGLLFAWDAPKSVRLFLDAVGGP
ncbi:MAG TPA: thiamine phosphate synthase [Rubricoccaceae bacterium]